MQGLINFEFKYDATKSYEEIFSKYSTALNGPLKRQVIMNYTSSHDDGGPFDKQRTKTIEAGTKLLLCPGSSQVYYGDETGRSLEIDGTVGDATLRSFMNWDELESNKSVNETTTQEILEHWQKLGQFRASHPSVGAGVHTQLSASPYYFKREYNSADYSDKVVVGLDLPDGDKAIDVEGIFANGELVKDYYSGKTVEVKNNEVRLSTPYSVVLLGQ